MSVEGVFYISQVATCYPRSGVAAFVGSVINPPEGIRDLHVDKRPEYSAEEEPNHLFNQLFACHPVTLLKAKLIVIKIKILFYFLKSTSCKVYKTTGYIYGSYTSKGGPWCFCLHFHRCHGTKV